MSPTGGPPRSDPGVDVLGTFGLKPIAAADELELYVDSTKTTPRRREGEASKEEDVPEEGEDPIDGKATDGE